MGAHHYKLALLPKSYFSFSQQLPAVLSAADVDHGEREVSGWWASHPPSPRLLNGLRSLLPGNTSWGETEEYLSSGDWGSDLRIWKTAGQVRAIHFRFSPIADPWSLIQQFLALAHEEDCLLLEQSTSALLQPQDSIIRDHFAASQSMQFLHDPAGTLVQAAIEFKNRHPS